MELCFHVRWIKDSSEQNRLGSVDVFSRDVKTPRGEYVFFKTTPESLVVSGFTNPQYLLGCSFVFNHARHLKVFPDDQPSSHDQLYQGNHVLWLQYSYHLVPFL